MYLDVCHNEQGVTTILRELRIIAAESKPTKVTVLALFAKHKAVVPVLHDISKGLAEL